MRGPSIGRLVLWVLVAVLTVSGCSGDSSDEPDAAASPESSASSSPTDAASPESSDTSEAGGSTTPGELPGRAVKSRVEAGAELSVMGVAYDEQLSVLVVPAGDEAVTAIGPTAAVAATGRSRKLDGQVWHEVEAGGSTGWVPAASLAWMGDTTDETVGLVRSRGERPVADSVERLGTIVTRSSSYNDPTSGTRVVQSAAPSGTDPVQVTYDITGIPDDSITGARLHLFAVPTDDGRWRLQTVELTTLCGRGLDDRGFCL